MNYDPSTNARILAEIEQNDKTVFFDAPGGVVAPTPTRFERKQTQRKTRKFRPDKEDNGYTESEGLNSRSGTFRSGTSPFKGHTVTS
ncbi:MAG: hypothetical protein ACK521_12775 [bacterium]|jgi:hypothetical protein